MALNKILGVEWRSAGDTVGFVLIENGVGQKSVRVGPVRREKIHLIDTNEENPFPASFVITNDTEGDARHIADHGAKLTYREALAFFPDLKEEEYKHG